jgi:catechol 2,3-dioxygenase
MHLRVTNLERSIRFYNEKLRLDMTVDWTSMGAAFLSEGGYHHHIGINTWYSLNGDVHRDDVTGLKNFTIIISNPSFYNSIRSSIIINDPTSENRLVQNDSNNKVTIMDPDRIQIVIRTE